MLSYSDIIIIFFLGTTGGFISGLLGVGGGIIFIPILQYYFERSGVHDPELVKFILGNSLFVIIFSGMIITYRQYKIKNFFPQEIIYTALPGMLSALAMAWLITQGTWYDKKLFNLIFIILLLPFALRMLFNKKADDAGNDSRLKTFQYQTVGFFTGIVSALSGLGGGIVMVPAFHNIFKMRLKKATSISTGVISFLVLPMGIFYLFTNCKISLHEWQQGYIVFPLVLPMIFGVAAVAPLGVWAAQKVSNRFLRILFASFTIGILIVRILQ